MSGIADFLILLFLQNLKDVLADLIPKEQTRIKNFKQQYGKTNIGQITVDMVSTFGKCSICILQFLFQSSLLQMFWAMPFVLFWFCFHLSRINGGLYFFFIRFKQKHLLHRWWWSSGMAWHGMVATHNPFRPAQGCLLCQVSLSGRLPQRSQYEPILAIRHVAAPL